MDHDYFGASADKLQINFWNKSTLWFMALFLMFAVVTALNKKEEVKKEGLKVTDDMVVDIFWPGCRKYETVGQFPKCGEGERVNIDIDLWGKSPDDARAVGYSNRAGKTFNLVRDDLGTSNDSTDQNTERITARGLPAGEYIINLHYYMNHDAVIEDGTEIPIDVIIRTKAKRVDGTPDPNGVMKEIIVRKATLRLQGEEITVVRFVIKENGDLDKESVNDFYQELRT